MNEREIFLTALDIAPPAERQHYLETACGGDPKLFERMLKLLRSSEAAGSFMESPAPALVVANPDQTMASQSGATVAADNLETHVLGDYRILKEIGRGGMGVVYQAEQISLGRQVALKVLPYASILDKTQLARFRNEARAAASLDHHNVVHVHSVGTERGVHYYAMQLIDGQTVGDEIAAEQRHRRATHTSDADSPPGSPGHEEPRRSNLPM